MNHSRKKSPRSIAIKYAGGPFKSYPSPDGGTRTVTKREAVIFYRSFSCFFMRLKKFWDSNALRTYLFIYFHHHSEGGGKSKRGLDYGNELLVWIIQVLGAIKIIILLCNNESVPPFRASRHLISALI